jgi:hypothetical protein
MNKSNELRAKLPKLELIAKRHLLTAEQIVVLPAVIERIAFKVEKPISFIADVAANGGEFGEEVARICRAVAA